MARTSKHVPFDLELADLPAPLRWREWMGRVEAILFASPVPVTREVLARVIGAACSLEALLADIRDELRSRPYELVAVAGGFQLRTRPALADALRASGLFGSGRPALSQHEVLVLTVVAYFQPLTRGELSRFFGKEISRDTIAALRAEGFIAAGPRSPTPGAPYTYVTTPAFLTHFGLDSLRDLPDREQLEEDGLLGKEDLTRPLPGAFRPAMEDDEEAEAEPVDEPEEAGLDNRTRSHLADEPIAAYLAREIDIVEGVRRGVADMKAGRLVAHDDAIAELDTTIEAAGRGKE